MANTTQPPVSAASPEQAERIAQVCQDLADGGKILLHHGVVDSFGHISARHPFNPERFLMARRLAPGLIEAGDIREFGLDGELIDKDGTPAFLERYIHSAIYAARPDVNSVIHSHSPSVVTFSVVKDKPLKAVCHTGKFLGAGAPIFEIRDVAGPATNMLITNQKLGEALVKTLGDHSIVLMRGHGSTVVGSSVQEAVFRGIYSEVGARIQAAAMALGEVTYLTAEEAATSGDTSVDALHRTWSYWKDLLAKG